MRIVLAREGRRGGRPGQGLLSILILSSLVACSVPSPKKQHREDSLREDLRSFHWALVGQEPAGALRYVPSDQRDLWEASFACILKQLRLLEYRVEHMRFGEGANESTVRVRWTVHPLDSLVVEEVLWKEEWSFDRGKQRWSLVPAPDAIQGLPEGCVPEVAESERVESAH